MFKKIIVPLALCVTILASSIPIFAAGEYGGGDIDLGYADSVYDHLSDTETQEYEGGSGGDTWVDTRSQEEIQRDANLYSQASDLAGQLGGLLDIVKGTLSSGFYGPDGNIYRIGYMNTSDAIGALATPAVEYIRNMNLAVNDYGMDYIAARDRNFVSLGQGYASTNLLSNADDDVKEKVVDKIQEAGGFSLFTGEPMAAYVNTRYGDPFLYYNGASGVTLPVINFPYGYADLQGYLGSLRGDLIKDGFSTANSLSELLLLILTGGSTRLPSGLINSDGSINYSGISNAFENSFSTAVIEEYSVTSLRNISEVGIQFQDLWQYEVYDDNNELVVQPRIAHSQILTRQEINTWASTLDEGYYTIVVKQKRVGERKISFMYHKALYLFDMRTKALLAASEVNGEGTGAGDHEIVLDTEIINDFYPTTTHRIYINDLGLAEFNGGAIEMIE